LLMPREPSLTSFLVETSRGSRTHKLVQSDVDVMVLVYIRRVRQVKILRSPGTSPCAGSTNPLKSFVRKTSQLPCLDPCE
jgi:hypothetical protein